MSERDYYPAGAYNDPNAPYNEPVIPERDFDVDVEFTMQKTVTVTTNEYQPEYDEEDGNTYANTDDTNWEDAYDESGYYTIPELLQELENYVRQDLERYKGNKTKERQLNALLESCQGWNVNDKSFTEA